MSRSPVPAVNILLSTNIDNLQDFIDSGEIPTTPHLGEGSYLFSSKNTNFIELTHTGGKSHEWELVLKIQDPDEVFITGIMHQNVLELMESELMNSSDKEFYVMYGLGQDALSHWAGPFYATLKNFNHFSSDTGTDIAELTFVPLLEYDAHMLVPDKPEPLARDNRFSIVKASTQKILYPAMTENNPLYSAKLGAADIGVGLGSIKEPAKWGGGVIPWTISTQDLLNAIRTLFTRYCQKWGLANVVILLSKEFKTILDKFEAYIDFSHKHRNITVKPGKTLLGMQNFLNQYGFDLLVDRKGSSDKYNISIDIDWYYRLSDDFMLPFKQFYSALSTHSNKVIKPHYLVENNIKIIKYLNASKYKKDIIIPESPVAFIGERNFILREVYHFNKVRPIMTPLSEEESGVSYRGKIRQYYNNKILAANNYFVGSDFALDVLDAVSPKDRTVRFEANTPQSNILSYSFDANPFTLAAIKRKLGKTIKVNKANVEGYIKKQLRKLQQDDFKYNISQVARAITAILVNSESSFQKAAKELTTPDKVNWKSSVDIYLRFFDDIAAKSGITGTIKTVPFFAYSDQFIWSTQCDVLIKKNPSLEKYPMQGAERDTYYNGRYLITGFKHVITSMAAYSEFSVNKVGLPGAQEGGSWSESRLPEKEQTSTTQSTSSYRKSRGGVVIPPRKNNYDYDYATCDPDTGYG